MRERFRVTATETLICLVVIALQAEIWLTRRPGATTGIAVVTIVCALLLAGLVVARLTARRTRAAGLLAQAAALREHAALAAERARFQRERHEVVAGVVNSVIVEIVAAQQALVRAAFPDDILTRLRAAEDAAHASLEELRRLDRPDESAQPDQTQRSSPAAQSSAA